MYSFYDPECDQKLLIQTQSPNFVQAIFILDQEARNIISQHGYTIQAGNVYASLFSTQKASDY